jgi:hypothetical protein
MDKMAEEPSRKLIATYEVEDDSKPELADRGFLLGGVQHVVLQTPSLSQPRAVPAQPHASTG